MRLSRPTLLALAFTFVACDDPSGPDTRYLGYLRLADIQPPNVDVMQDGDSLVVSVGTYGLDGCYEVSGEDVVVDDRELTIKPFDRIDRDEDELCPDAIVILPHEVAIDDAEVGVWTVRVIGTRYDGGDVEPDSVVTQFEVVTPPASN